MDDLPRIPIVDRATLQEFSSDDWKTSRQKAAVIRKTSGTVGEPLELSLSAQAYAMQLAVRANFLETIGLELGSRQGRFWGRSTSLIKSSFFDALLARKDFAFTDNATQNRQTLALRKFRPAYLYGYSSLLSMMAGACHDSRIRVSSIKAVISTAEMLHDFQRQLMEEAFESPVFREFGCSELDIIAFDCDQKTLHVAPTNVFVEAETSGNTSELVVTGLESDLMPLIRYRIGDSGEVSARECACGQRTQIIDELHGRSAEQLVKLSDSRQVHCTVFFELVKEIEPEFKLRAFQIVQEQIDVLHWYVDCEDRGRFGDLETILKKRTCDILEERLDIKVSIGPIQRSPSGKLTDFIPLQLAK
jgi:phenylacetate-CoA ligase